MKMDKIIIKFDDTEQKNTNLTNIKAYFDRQYINKIGVSHSNKVSFGIMIFNIFLAIKMLKRQTFVNIPSKNDCIQKRF